MAIDFEGIVTDVNLEYCKFVLNQRKTIYAGYLFASCNKIRMPIINSRVIVSKCELYNDNTLFLNSTSNISGDKYVSEEDTKQCKPFIKLIREHKLNFFNMMYIENTVKKLKKDNVFSSDFLTLLNITQIIQVEDLIFKTIPFIDKKIKYNDSELSKYKIFTPRQHKLEEGAQEIVCKIYWSHGVQSFENKACLIGLLRVSPDMGFIILQDAFYLIVCEIAPDPDRRAEYSAQLSKLLNNFVLMENYHIFLERTADNPMIHYIFVNIRDVQILLSVSRNTELEFKGDPSENKVIAVDFKIIHRCTVSIKNKSLNCWIQCEIKTPNSNIFRECFFILNGRHFTKYPLMNPDDEYMLSSSFKSFNEQMTTFKSGKYYTINGKRIPVFYIPNDAKLTLKSCVKNHLVGAVAQDFSLSALETVEVVDSNKRKREEERLPNKQTANDLLTFEAIIKKRRTVSPNRFAPKPVDNKCFGIRGTQVHQIILKPINQKESSCEITQAQLQVYEDENLEEAERLYQENLDAKPPPEETVNLYMHNWQELQLPLGLVHGMTVSVRNVRKPQGSKYVKPTFVTRIQPMAYEPEQEFQTAFEFLNNADWGLPVPLSASHGIPVDSVCWTPTLTVKFTALSVKMRCPICKESYVPGQQTCCNRDPRDSLDLDLMMGVQARDNRGIFDAVSRDEKVFRMLLGVKDNKWGLWRKAFDSLKWWTMNPQDFLELQGEGMRTFRTHHQDVIADSLTQRIVSFNKQSSHNFDLKCRKLVKNDRDLYFNQKWYIVDIRPSSKPKDGLYDILYLS